MAQRSKVLNLQQIAFLFLAESVFCKILIYDNKKKKCNHRPMTQNVKKSINKIRKREWYSTVSKIPHSNTDTIW